MALAVIAASAMPLSHKSDPILLTIDGQPTTLSEFTHYYTKNCVSDSGILSPEEYLDLFINFKLKVLDAIKEGRETTESFQSEYNRFREETLAPFLVDSALFEAMVSEAYAHTSEDVNVSHIMLGTTQNDFNTLEKILVDLRSGKCDFDSIADKISVDPSVRSNHGHLGWITAGRYPYDFEKVAYSTASGEYSQPFNSGFGYHILRVNSKRPSLGQVHARHILRMAHPENKKEMDKARRSSDSIRILIKNGKDFAEIARMYSDDKNSAIKGGDLGWFSAGVMVMPFDSVVFALAENEVSSPFATRFGYHIVQILDRRYHQPLDSVRKSIEKSILSDGRAITLREAKLQSLRNLYNLENESDLEVISKYFSDIERNNPEIAASLKEYRDGILLFDISSEKVWNKASADTLGLQEFFAQHRDNYSWDAPHYKALLIYTSSLKDKKIADSILDRVPEDMPDIDVAQKLRSALSHRVRIERIIVRQGENDLADYFAFGGKRPTRSGQWSKVRAFRGKIISAPESLSDVRSKVLADRQDEIEKEWLNTIKKKYKVKVNRKLLKQIPDLRK